MSDYIRREDAIRLAEQGQVQGFPWQFQMLVRLSPTDVAPVIHGRWLPIVSYNNTYKCSECGRFLVDIADGLKMVAKHYPYCHCGAKMEE